MLHEDEDVYRERMEAFVSGLTGTSMVELVLVSIPIPMGIWLLGEAKVRLDSRERGLIIVVPTYLPCAHLTCPGCNRSTQIKQALLAGRRKALLMMSWHFFVLELLAVVFPAIASMVWPQLTVTLVLSMAITSEISCGC